MEENEEMIAKNNNRAMGPVAENTDNTSSTSRPTPPTNSDGSEMQMGTPPEMNCDSDSENCEMPEPPEGFDGEMPSDMQGGEPGSRGEFTTLGTNSNPDAILHPVAYLSIGAGSMILGILISYMCFSKFFHLKPGQTFASRGKFIWFIVVALVLTVGICTLGFFIPKWVS
ncbi:hypothetical protein IJI18_02880 [Candidatus Saccharibacteria bacterium]|nr:hypothetical protein [Candidatus Saccharibacteria bacterium]